MNVQGENLFPLRKIDSNLSGYFVNSAGEIISTRATNKLTKLNGSRANPRANRYVTLAGRNYLYESVVASARANPDFVKDTGGVRLPKTEYKDTGAMGFGRTKSASEVVKAKGIMLATIGEHDQLVFGSKPVFHKEDKTARAEAERIAKESGLKVVMLQVVGAVSVGKTVWE